MNVYFDTEFTGLVQTTTLISLGLITEFGQTFYAEFNDYNTSQVDAWIRINVISNLKYNDRDDFIIDDINNYVIKGSSIDIQEHLYKWLKQFNTKIEMWSDCLAYDWVLLCNLFGGAFNMPNFIFYIPFDICTFFKVKDIDPDINREEYSGFTYDMNSKHNSLHDCKVIKGCYEKLMGKH